MKVLWKKGIAAMLALLMACGAGGCTDSGELSTDTTSSAGSSAEDDAWIAAATDPLTPYPETVTVTFGKEAGRNFSALAGTEWENHNDDDNAMYDIIGGFLNIDIQIDFVGNGGDRDEVIAYSEKLGLSDCVFFTAPAYDRNVIRAWYCRADLFLFPSTFDTNGLVVREAAACGLGSVLVRGSCAAEDIRDGESGFLIEENAESMARMLTALSRNPEAMRRVGKTAQDEIYISWKDAVTHAQARYEVVLENFKAGKYPAHNRQSDEAFHAISSYLAAVGRGQEKIKLRMEELSERFL